jgi:hypothetical protein
VRDGGDARAQWLPAFDGVAATRGLEGECETHLSAAQAGAIHCAHQAAPKDRPPIAFGQAVGGRSEPELEYGSDERQVGRRTVVPHSDGGRPFPTGVCLSGSGSRPDGNESGSGAAKGKGGTRAGHHNNTSMERALQSLFIEFLERAKPTSNQVNRAVEGQNL